MDKTHFEFKILDLILPVYVILMLKRKGQTHIFSFIFCAREKKEEFVLNYPKDQFPPNKSIEIMICETPEGLKEHDHRCVHIATNEKQSSVEHYVCHYPGSNNIEALNIAKFWAQYNLMYLETGSTSTDREDVMSFKLDEEIRVIEIR